MPNYSPDYKEIKAVLDKHNIKGLYHFTDISNLPLILKCDGLWSKERLENANLLSKVITGGNSLSKDLDIYWGNWDKVSLNWGPKMPMMWHIQQQRHLCFFVIKPEIALQSGVVFTDKNATDNTQKREQGILGLNLIDFSAIKDPYANTNPERKKKKQAEILVSNEVSFSQVANIVFISEAGLNEGKRLWGNKPHPPFKINKNLFHEGFPVLDSVILTSSDISKDNVDLQSFEHEDKFCLGVQKITLLTSVKATPCLEAKTVWFSAKEKKIYESTTTFENQNTYWHWSSINAVNLSAGEYYVEYYIGNIRWITIPFTLFDF